MGGVAGHMDHLYDDRDLTFSKMKEIILAASRGKITAEEKVDGQNLFLSYSVKDGNARAARNLTNIKEGGMTAAGLADKFAGRGGLLEAFTQGFATFEKAVSLLSDEEKAKAFGNNTDIWYNAEVMFPSNPNVIHYDTKTLKIHDSGHKRRNRETGRPENADVSESLAVLDNNLKKMQKTIAVDSDVRFVRSAILKLKKLEDDVAANAAINAIDKAISQEEISDTATVLDYLKQRISRSAPLAELEIPEEKKKDILARALKLENAPTLTQIKKGLSDEQKEDIGPVTSKNGTKALVKNAIQPIEMAIHNFAVEMLRSVQSLFINNPSKEVARLRETLTSAVEQITQLATDGVIGAVEMDTMRAELNKIKNIDDISSTVEGVVFDFDGHTYKFTGSFAPLNQILGMLTFSKQKAQAGQEQPGNRIGENLLNKYIDSFLLKEVSVTGVITEEEEGKKVALLPGGFKPPHSGHYQLAKHLSKLSDIDEVLVIIGKNSRTSEGEPKITITADQSKQLWETYTKNDNNIKIRIQEGKTPVADVYDLIANPDEFKAGDTVVLGKSDKDEGDKRFDRAASYAERHNPGVAVEQVITPQFGGKGMGGTNMRNIIAKGDKKDFISKLPDHLSEEEKEMSWGLVSGTNENLNRSLDSMIDEISSMAGGSVEMGGSPFSKLNNYDPFSSSRKRSTTKKPTKRRASVTRRRRPK